MSVCVCVTQSQDLGPYTPSITKWLHLVGWTHTQTHTDTHTHTSRYIGTSECWSVGGPCTHKKLKPSQEIRNVCLPPRWSSVRRTLSLPEPTSSSRSSSSLLSPSLLLLHHTDHRLYLKHPGFRRHHLALLSFHSEGLLPTLITELWR